MQAYFYILADWGEPLCPNYFPTLGEHLRYTVVIFRQKAASPTMLQTQTKPKWKIFSPTMVPWFDRGLDLPVNSISTYCNSFLNQMQHEAGSLILHHHQQSYEDR